MTVNVVSVLPTGGTVCWSICGKFRPVFALISTGSNVFAASISLRSDFAVASSRGGMVGEGKGASTLRKGRKNLVHERKYGGS